MRIVFQTLGSLLFLSQIFSCVNAEKKAHLESLDRLKSELDSLENKYKTSPLDSFPIIRDDAAAIEKDVKTYFIEDTIDQFFAEKMIKLRDIRKSKGYISKRKQFLDTIFVFQNEQIAKLRHDIENDAGQRDSYDKFVEAEKSNVLIIKNSYQEFDKRFSMVRNNYYEIADAIRMRVKPFKDKALMQ